MWDWITADLRFYVKKSKMTGTALARKLERSPSNISNILAGRRRISDKDAEVLDELWHLNGHFGRLLRYARLGSDKEWFGQFKQHEAEAKVIKTFEALVVPGLLQLPEYVAELARAGGAPRDVVQDLVDERIARQAVFSRDQPPTTWFLLAQTAIDWPIGGSDLMRKQLAHLLEMSDLPGVGIRVIPRSAGAYAGVDGSFSLIYGAVDVAYTESPGGGRLVPSASEVLEYGIRYDRISESALPRNASLNLIRQAMEAL
jgi:hypothetical protein